ncbi:MAG: hypothetical protein CMO43_04305 [Verrucomicrobiales bacterium]|nr:hypothetical protein [Verrucomicrobiales bacterium]
MALSIAPFRLAFSWRSPERSLSSLAKRLVSSGVGTAERASLSLASLRAIELLSDSTLRLRIAISRRAAAGSSGVGLAVAGLASPGVSAPMAFSFRST